MAGCSQSRLETGDWIEYGVMLRTEKRELYWARRHSRAERISGMPVKAEASVSSSSHST